MRIRAIVLAAIVLLVLAGCSKGHSSEESSARSLPDPATTAPAASLDTPTATPTLSATPTPTPSASATPTPQPTVQAQPTAQPTPTQPLPAAQRTTSDPFEFCALVGTADWPVEQYAGRVRYAGPSQPFPGQFWRCWAGKVLGCQIGARGDLCQKPDTSREPPPFLVQVCKEKVNGSLLGFETPRTSIYYWECRGGVPVITGQHTQLSEIDALGYLIGPWVEIRTQAQPAPSPAAQSTPTSALPPPPTPSPSPTALSRMPSSRGIEFVTVEKVDDSNYRVIITRANGEVWLLEYGVGCLSLWLLEGRQVIISSPGLFAGVGSQIIIPDRDQSCRIWDRRQVR